MIVSKFLVVDDDPDILELLCTWLGMNGYSAVGVPDAKRAVERVRELMPDMLLIDYMLPDIDGMTTLQRCRAEPGREKRASSDAYRRQPTRHVGTSACAWV
jgi:CheY-like chemotaxis protein